MSNWQTNQHQFTSLEVYKRENCYVNIIKFIITSFDYKQNNASLQNKQNNNNMRYIKY